MTPEDIIKTITCELDGVTPKSSWGETSLFYNPGKVLPNGVYFCTIKEKDGENDCASNLNRSLIYRLSIGISKKTFEQRFGPKPARPPKGGIIDTGHEFSAINQLMPHPIYGWMSWVQILNPEQPVFTTLWPLITEAHSNAVIKFNKRTKALKT